MKWRYKYFGPLFWLGFILPAKFSCLSWTLPICWCKFPFLCLPRRFTKTLVCTSLLFGQRALNPQGCGWRLHAVMFTLSHELRYRVSTTSTTLLPSIHGSQQVPKIPFTSQYRYIQDLQYHKHYTPLLAM